MNEASPEPHSSSHQLDDSGSFQEQYVKGNGGEVINSGDEVTAPTATSEELPPQSQPQSEYDTEADSSPMQISEPVHQSFNGYEGAETRDQPTPSQSGDGDDADADIETSGELAPSTTSDDPVAEETVGPAIDSDDDIAPLTDANFDVVGDEEAHEKGEEPPDTSAVYAAGAAVGVDDVVDDGLGDDGLGDDGSGDDGLGEPLATKTLEEPPQPQSDHGAWDEDAAGAAVGVDDVVDDGLGDDGLDDDGLGGDDLCDDGLGDDGLGEPLTAKALEEPPQPQSDPGAWDEEAPKKEEGVSPEKDSLAGGLESNDTSAAYAAAVAGGATAAVNKTVVEHRIITEPSTTQKKKNKTARFLGPVFGIFMSKPVIGMVLMYTMFATGAWAYLLQNTFALTAQIEELEAQVDRLAAEVDELETQVDRYEAENEKLEENLQEYAELNDQLNASNAEFAKQNAFLNASVVALGEQNDRLNASNAEYARLNTELNETAQQLESQVDELEAAVDDIGEVVLEAARQNDALLNETELLQQLNGTLTEQVDAINGVVVDMNDEIARLNDLVDDLETILSFLEEAAGEVGESVEEIAQFLAEQIAVNRGLLIETLQNTYRQISSSWVCSFRAVFSGEPFVEDANIPIGASSYDDVITFVESEVLEPLCLDTDDFEVFLAVDIGSAVPPVDVTFNQLISAVAQYTTAALDYYFPDEGETGLTAEDWAAAEYDCNNLPEDKKFTSLVA